MPDLLTHLASSHIFRRLSEVKKKRIWAQEDSTLFYLGTILPDMFSKPPAILFPTPKLIWLVSATHAPVSFLFLSYLLVMLLKEESRSRGFKFLIAGGLLHFTLDILQKHLTSGAYYWFFPFSWWTFNIPLFWPSDSILALPFLIGIISILEFIFFRNKRRRGTLGTIFAK